MRLTLLSTVVLGTVALATPSTAIAATFNFTGGLQTYTVTQSGVYNILAYGAEGSGTRFVDYGVIRATIPGGGGVTGANFNLTAGEILTILVGETGIDSTNGIASGGGGGGSFVTLNRAC
jgi:hypothetical protein